MLGGGKVEKNSFISRQRGSPWATDLKIVCPLHLFCFILKQFLEGEKGISLLDSVGMISFPIYTVFVLYSLDH